MEDQKAGYNAEGQIIGAVGEGATAHFYSLPPNEIAALVEQVVTKLLPLIERTLQAADPARAHETLARDGEGNVIVGQAAVVVTPLQAEALRRALHELPADAPAEVRQRLAAVAQALSDNLVPPADFTCRAREYAARQEAQRGPLDKAEAEEPLYVPLELHFRRAIRAPGDDLFRREEQRTYDDI